MLALPAALLVGAVAGQEGGASVVVREQGGRVVREARLPDSGRFDLEYVHSRYGAPARERFVAEDGGEGFRMISVESPHEGVLDYYALDGVKRRRPGGLALEARRPRRYDDLALIATSTGRRTLRVGDRRYPLWEEGGRPAHLRVSVEAERGP